MVVVFIQVSLVQFFFWPGLLGPNFGSNFFFLIFFQDSLAQSSWPSFFGPIFMALQTFRQSQIFGPSILAQPIGSDFLDQPTCKDGFHPGIFSQSQMRVEFGFRISTIVFEILYNVVIRLIIPKARKRNIIT